MSGTVNSNHVNFQILNFFWHAQQDVLLKGVQYCENSVSVYKVSVFSGTKLYVTSCL